MRHLLPLILLLITWSPVTKDTTGNPVTVTGYNIYCAPTSAGPFTTLTATVTTPYYFNPAVTGSQYCQVTALVGSAESVHSVTSTQLTIGLPQ